MPSLHSDIFGWCFLFSFQRRKHFIYVCLIVFGVLVSILIFLFFLTFPDIFENLTAKTHACFFLLFPMIFFLFFFLLLVFSRLFFRKRPPKPAFFKFFSDFSQQFFFPTVFRNPSGKIPTVTKKTP